MHGPMELVTLAGLFYFMLGDIHPKYRSCFQMIQLAAICKSEIIPKYSLDAVLQHQETGMLLTRALQNMSRVECVNEVDVGKLLLLSSCLQASNEWQHKNHLWYCGNSIS